MDKLYQVPNMFNFPHLLQGSYLLLGREFWLGLNKMYELTQSANCNLLVRLTDADDVTVEECYETFAITENVSQRPLGEKMGSLNMSESIFSKS